MPGILTRLQSLVPTYTGIRAGLARPDTARPRPDAEERIPAEVRAAVGGRVWFLPFADSTTTGDTPEIRAAMRVMERDPYVKTAWFTQVLTVLAQEFQVHHPTARKNPAAQDQVDFVRHAFEQADGEMVGTGSAVLTALGSDGFSLSEKVWQVLERGKYAGKLTLKGLKPKDPEHLTLVGDEFRNVTGVRVNRTNETFPITDFVYTRYLHKFDEPMGMAPFRASYGAYWFRDTVRKLRVIRAEKADGLLLGTYTDPADKGTLEAALQRAKTSTWMSIPEGVKVEAVEKARSTESDFKSFDESLREEILVGIAYAHLHILQGGVSDARGDTKVHKAVSDLGPWLLTYLVQTALNRQVIPDLIDYNYPGGAADGDYPRITLGGVTNQEVLEQFQVLDAAQRAGFRPSRSHYAGVLTIQEADPEDPADQLAPPQQADPFGMMGGGGGGFGADPFGGAGVPAGPTDPFGGGGGDPTLAFGEGVERFGWQPARSRTGGVKAVGTGEQQGQMLYGRRAEAALAAGNKGRPGETPKDGRSPGLDADTVTRAAAGDREATRRVRATGTRAVGRGAAELAGSLAAGGPNLAEAREIIQLELADQPPAVSRRIDRFITEATGHTPETAAAGARAAAARLISWVGSLGVKGAKLALRGLAKVAVALGKFAARKAGEAAWSLVGPPIIWAKALGPPVAGHLALVLGGAALAASALYLPATVPFAAKLLIAGATAGAVRYGMPRVIDRTTGAAIGKLENDSIGTRRTDDLFAEHPPGFPGPAQRRATDLCRAAAFAEPSTADEVALAGRDGARAAQLLARAKSDGRAVLQRLAGTAVARLLADPDPGSAPVLFDDDELRELAGSLSATTATADLLGRARMLRLAARARERGERFAEGDPDPFHDFAEAPPALAPAEAVDYFRRLIPTLGVDPARYGPRLDRHAFTLAVAADEALLGKVKGVIAERLQTGRGTAADIDDILDAAGVGRRNSQMGELIYRVNVMDSYNQGQVAELQSEGMRDIFPGWRYEGIRDGRQGKDHEPHFDKLYPSSVPFHEVRGPRIYNCRCSFTPVTRAEWERAGGAS